ncbi:MAG: AI-2E family transporter [Patescibacteria group bacterium]|jgi:predicted PurR-regulated permease PerM
MGKEIERSVTIKTSTVLKVFALLASLWFMWLIRDILGLLAAAVFLAAVVHPVARWGEKYKIPKGVTVILVYVAMFAVFGLSFALIIPTLLQQVNSLSQTIGSSITILSSAVQNVRDFTDQYGLSGNLNASVETIETQLSQTASSFVAAIGDLFGGFARIVIVLAMAFYMVVQDREAIRLFRNLVPDPYQEKIVGVLLQVEVKISKWLSSQLILSLAIGFLYYIGLLVLGIDSALALAMFAGFTEFIPYLGPILGGIPIIIVAFGDSPVKALLALILVVIIQQLENHIIVPKLMQKALGLNPLASIIAVLIGAKLFGVVGALVAIPVATAISVVLSELYRSHQERGEENQTV